MIDAVASSALEVRDLQVSFALPGRGRRRLAAVDHVDLTLERGEVLGLVGESGCGKSSLGRALVGLIPVQGGSISVRGTPMGRRRTTSDRRRMQMVFQDPTSSLNPRMRLGKMLGELLRVHDVVPASQITARCRELLQSVGLSADLLDAYPATLSGGQRQRVSIARALALQPDIIVADEVTSALDVSIQAQVLALLLGLNRELGLSLLFISHNLAVVRQVSDRVAVMYLGRIVEQGPTEQLFADPQHPYTRLLLASVLKLNEVNLGADDRAGEPPDATNPPSGCSFHPRCPLAQEICADSQPNLRVGSPDHAAACHFAWNAGVPLKGHARASADLR